MLPLSQKILFLVFAAITGALGLRGFYRLYRRIAAGRPDTDSRFDRLPRRVRYALMTSLTQSRTFRKRPVVSFFHSFIFYGFTFYLLVNLVDALEGFVPLPFAALGAAGSVYTLFADVLGALVLAGVIALVLRRFLLPSRRDFSFNQRTVLHPQVQAKYIAFDSIAVSAFILFHVGSRAVGAGAKVAAEGSDRFAPFATLLSHLFTPRNALAWRIFGYWGALGSVLAFLAYFPRSKHIHIFMAPLKYVAARPVTSGVLPTVELDIEAEAPKLGAKSLEDLAWPRLLDAYACIQCNRCQDVCPATATGKSLSPSALEINKRMELNVLARTHPGFEAGAPSPNPLLTFALSPEAAWACTTCGACIDICPVGDEPMLDIVDIRRQQVMMEGEFPPQLQAAFRGMERAQNPWGINHDKRLDWAAGLKVKTTDENPEPEVLFWVGCAASYDPQSQKTARAFVQLLDHAGVDFAVLGKRECCTGDTARRAGNEYLYRQLADTNVATLNQVKPRLIVATCPHCMNTVGNEYKQLGGDFKVIHHTQYLESLVASGKLLAEPSPASVTYHDPCYLGRHNGVYDAPRNLLRILSNDVVELPRHRENSFCCGAGGAQFWKEEEEGSERISDNRYREAQQTLASAEDKVLAVGCPFCKSMLDSTPAKEAGALAVRDLAELLLEGVRKRAGIFPLPDPSVALVQEATMSIVDAVPAHRPEPAQLEPLTETAAPEIEAFPAAPLSQPVTSVPENRKKWTPKSAPPGTPGLPPAEAVTPDDPVIDHPPVQVTRKPWKPKLSPPEER
jgi:Fe-S oxidoreductase